MYWMAALRTSTLLSLFWLVISRNCSLGSMLLNFSKPSLTLRTLCRSLSLRLLTPMYSSDSPKVSRGPTTSQSGSGILFSGRNGSLGGEKFGLSSEQDSKSDQKKSRLERELSKLELSIFCGWTERKAACVCGGKITHTHTLCWCGHNPFAH